MQRNNYLGPQSVKQLDVFTTICPAPSGVNHQTWRKEALNGVEQSVRGPGAAAGFNDVSDVIIHFFFLLSPLF